MKIEVTIPDGVYCENCPFKISKECAFLHGKHLSTGVFGEIKAEGCPNLAHKFV